MNLKSIKQFTREISHRSPFSLNSSLLLLWKPDAALPCVLLWQRAVLPVCGRGSATAAELRTAGCFYSPEEEEEEREAEEREDDLKLYIFEEEEKESFTFLTSGTEPHGEFTVPLFFFVWILFMTSTWTYKKKQKLVHGRFILYFELAEIVLKSISRFND